MPLKHFHPIVNTGQRLGDLMRMLSPTLTPGSLITFFNDKVKRTLVSASRIRSAIEMLNADDSDPGALI